MSGNHDHTDHFRRLVELIVSGDSLMAIGLLEVSPQLAGECATHGATRQAHSEDFFARIAHYMYAGDTALHMAAAAKQSAVVKKLVSMGANVSARNRRGAEPLHYAADGGPGSPAWNPTEQSNIISMIIRAGADPNAVDKSGVAPLHRAVRNRSAAAVAALIAGGADPTAPNAAGSTPMLLARENTGKSGSGSPEAREQRQEIVRLLLDHGAQ
jgi:ankyrin repeat protein